jgi:hypothetical protein
VGFLPASVADQVYQYVPAAAGQAVMYLVPDPVTLRPWTGLGVFCLYAAVALGLGAWRLRHRDA